MSESCEASLNLYTAGTAIRHGQCRNRRRAAISYSSSAQLKRLQKIDRKERRLCDTGWTDSADMVIYARMTGFKTKVTLSGGHPQMTFGRFETISITTAKAEAGDRDRVANVWRHLRSGLSSAPRASLRLLIRGWQNQPSSFDFENRFHFWKPAPVAIQRGRKDVFSMIQFLRFAPRTLTLPGIWNPSGTAFAKRWGFHGVGVCVRE